MGFFESVGTFLHGDDQPAQSRSQSGFALLPEEVQSAYTGYAKDLTRMFKGGAADDMLTPLPQTEYETTALNAIGKGFTPTAETLQSDISMQMNPFDNYVINDINREAAGGYSIFKTALDEAGQFGSNRQILGANDIENTRLNMIGKFKQDQYNKALDNSLNQLTQQRAADAGLQMGAGEFLRGLDTGTRQAPVNAITRFGKLLSVLPTSGGSESNRSGPVDEYGAMDFAGDVGKVAAIFSDERLKNIYRKVGEENGHNLYEFSYIADPGRRYIGVIAQEVKEKNPEAVYVKDGFLAVDYARIGVEMKELA
jgi:hypothetical protein